MFRRFNTTDMMDVFAMLNSGDPPVLVSPIDILMNYAWWFERNRYDWHIMVPERSLHNRRLPMYHKVPAQYTTPAFVAIQHTDKRWHQNMIMPGYCSAMTFQGTNSPKCRNVRLTELCTSTTDKLCFKKGGSCKQGNPCCMKVVDKHLRNVNRMIEMQVHFVNASKARLVETLATSMETTCELFDLP